MEGLRSNVFDTALIFEGGGMRASYSCAVACALLEAGIHFDHVYGVSAGSSNAINYLSRDIPRTKASFTTLALDPNFGDAWTFLRHKGLFNAHYLYMESCAPDGALPFDFDAYLANPADATIASFERDTGRSCFWSKKDMRTLEDLMGRIYASSTLPLVMPPIAVEGRKCYDGGLAEGSGLLLPQARKDGFARFFVVRTRPRGFRKPRRIAGQPLYDALFWRRPHMRSAMRAWGPGYNAVCDELERLEEAGAACVVYADDITAESGTRDIKVLEENFERGWNLSQRELSNWKDFLHLA